MRAGRDLLFFRRVVPSQPILHDGRRRRRGGVPGAGEKALHAWPSSMKDALSGSGEVIVRLDEEIAFDNVGRGIPCREGVPVAQAVRAPVHGSVDIGGEHVRCAGERREEPLGHAFVRIKASYLQDEYPRWFCFNFLCFLP